MSRIIYSSVKVFAGIKSQPALCAAIVWRLKRAETDDIKYEYKALPNGAQIHYSTEYPQYVQALHEWFDAQMSEHGNEVVPEHIKHHSTPAE
jgi:hypothetical protein